MNEERIRRANETDFFHRYFSPSGSIYFQHTPAHKNIYEKVYTDDRGVVLFWKHRSQGRQAVLQFRPDICPHAI